MEADRSNNQAVRLTEISAHAYFLCKNHDVFLWVGRLARFPRSRS